MPAANHDFIPRLQANRLRASLQAMRVVVVTGPRQTGKTTLVREIGRSDGRVFHTLDRPETLALAERDPEALWAGLHAVTIDEVQRSPALLDHLKLEVDREPAKGRFILTGSANLLLMREVADSLAGRAAYVVLPPLTVAERVGATGGELLRLLVRAPDVAAVLRAAGRFPAREGWTVPRVVFEGGFPEAVSLPTDEARRLWRDGYLATYLERDLRNLSQIADLPDFVRLARLAALRSGQLVNVDGLARDSGIAPSTARRWLNLLEVSCLAVTLRAYSPSHSRRLIKAPKLHLTDSGVACHLCGIVDTVQLEGSAQLGQLFETAVLHHLQAFVPELSGVGEITYWRTARGEEVDFVVETPGRLLPIEVKTTRSLGTRDLRGLAAFLAEYPGLAPFGVVLHAGDEWFTPARNVAAIPWTSMLGY